MARVGVAEINVIENEKTRPEPNFWFASDLSNVHFFFLSLCIILSVGQTEWSRYVKRGDESAFWEWIGLLARHKWITFGVFRFDFVYWSRNEHSDDRRSTLHFPVNGESFKTWRNPQLCHVASNYRTQSVGRLIGANVAHMEKIKKGYFRQDLYQYCFSLFEKSNILLSNLEMTQISTQEKEKKLACRALLLRSLVFLITQQSWTLRAHLFHMKVNFMS